MKIFILTLLYFVFIHSQISNAQNPQAKIDSLLDALKTAKEDTNKVYLIMSIANFYFNNDQQMFLKYANQSLALSEKLSYDQGKIRSLHVVSGYHFVNGSFDSALFYLNSSKELIEKTGNKILLRNLYANIASNYDSKGEYAKAKEYGFKALKLSEELNDTFTIAGITSNIGIISEMQGDYFIALNYYLKALKLREEIMDSTGIANTSTAIGNVYYYQKEFDKSLTYLFSSLKICDIINDKGNAASCNFSIGLVYIEQGKVQEALKYFQKALSLSTDLNERMLMGSAYGGIGNAYSHLNNLDSALYFHTKALNILTEIGDKSRMSEQYHAIGDIYLKMKNYSQALTYLKKALSLALEAGTKEILTEIYKNLSDVYSKTNNYKMAYDSYVLHSQMNDSLRGVESSKKIAEIQGKYDVDKKDKEIIVLTKDKEIQNIEIKKQKQLKYSFIGGLGMVIVLLLFGYRTYRAQQVLRLQDIRNKIAGDLHDDIGSTLNSISIYSAVAKKKDEHQDDALEMIGEASRKIIDAMSDIVWTVNPDNDNFAKIIFRMKSLAYNLFRAKQIEFTFHSDEILDRKKLSLEVRRNFYLIFKEAINNLVKYSNATRVAITVSSESDYIKLRIQDNGVGFDISEDNSGNGLKSMMRRADEMKAEYKIESSKGNGTRIELILKA